MACPVEEVQSRWWLKWPRASVRTRRLVVWGQDVRPGRGCRLDDVGGGSAQGKRRRAAYFCARKRSLLAPSASRRGSRPLSLVKPTWSCPKMWKKPRKVDRFRVGRLVAVRRGLREGAYPHVDELLEWSGKSKKARSGPGRSSSGVAARRPIFTSADASSLDKVVSGTCSR